MSVLHLWSNPPPNSYELFTKPLLLPYGFGSRLFSVSVMATLKKEFEPELSPAKNRPIELQTENGFCILRSWEIDRLPAPIAGKYDFLVRNPHGLERAREIVVEVARDAVAEIERYTRGRIAIRNSFWIYCAERHLATYVWKNDDYPPEGLLIVKQLTGDDFDLAIRWETT